MLCAERCPTLTNMLVIIVGGIPIAMPTVLSVTLALGAAKLAKVPTSSLFLSYLSSHPSGTAASCACCFDVEFNQLNHREHKWSGIDDACC